MEIEKNISELKFRCIPEERYAEYCDDGDMRVKSTAHYKFACSFLRGGGDPRPYLRWQSQRGKDINQKLLKFMRLCLDIRDKGHKNPIVVNGNEIEDGHHRAAVVAALGKDKIRCKIAA